MKKLVSIVLAGAAAFSLCSGFVSAEENEKAAIVSNTQYASVATLDEPDSIPMLLLYIPRIGQIAAVVESGLQVQSNQSSIAVNIGRLPDDVDSVNVRIHDDMYGTDTTLDQFIMFVCTNQVATFFDRNYIQEGHTYSVMMSANGTAGGNVWITATVK